MKVAIATDHGNVSAHFGRCQTYTIVTIEDENIIEKTTISNPGHQPGFLPRFLSEQGVSCIIAGGMGPRAQNLFEQKNINTITGVQGTVDEVIDKFTRRELNAGEDLCGHRHEPSDSSKGDIHTSEGHHHHEEEVICVTAAGKDLDAEIDPRFGRSSYLLFINTGTGSFEALENPAGRAGQGAGIQTAQIVADKGASVLFTGDCGPKARSVLQAAGVDIKTGSSGKVKDILNQKDEGEKNA